MKIAIPLFTIHYRLFTFLPYLLDFFLDSLRVDFLTPFVREDVGLSSDRGFELAFRMR